MRLLGSVTQVTTIYTWILQAEINLDSQVLLLDCSFSRPVKVRVECIYIYRGVHKGRGIVRIKARVRVRTRSGVNAIDTSVNIKFTANSDISSNKAMSLEHPDVTLWDVTVKFPYTWFLTKP